MKIRRVVALCLLALTATTAAHARPDKGGVDLAEEADLHFNRAIGHYQAGEFDQALEYLLRSNRLVPNRNVAFNIARCYEQLERFDEAFRHYHDVFVAETDPEGKANARAAIERIRPRVALLEVQTDPPGAEIFIDREDLGARGRSPQTLALPSGDHAVIVALEGYEPARVDTVTLARGGSQKVDLKLERILGTVSVQGEPAGATVRLEGSEQSLGAVPGEFPLPPGQQVLIVEAEGHETSRLPIVIEARKTTRTEIALPLVTGRIVVDGDEAGALIEIDGAARGFIPEVVEDVPIGAHTVTVRLPGYAVYSVEVEVEPRAESRVYATLEPLNEVVGASRRVESVDDAPASVTLITGREIRAFGYETLYDALQGTRGVFPSNDRIYTALGVRGFARAGDYGNRLLVSVDGHSINDDQNGSSYVDRDFAADLGDVARIEFVRGPGSALYGTNAFFGVINVVTHDAESMPAPHVELAHGGPREVRARAGASAGDEEAGFWVSGGGLTGQGEAVTLRLDDGSRQTIADADDVSGGSVSGKGWWGPLTLQGHFVTRDKQVPNGAFETIPGDPESRAEDQRGFIEVRYEPSLTDDPQLLTRAYFDVYEYEGGFPYDDPEVGLAKDTWSGAWAGVEARLVGDLGDSLRYTVGGEARSALWAELSSRDASGPYLDANPEVQVFSGFGVIDWRPIDWAALSVGARVDDFSTFGTQLSPRAALILEPSEHDLIKIIGGRAFRAPSPYELEYNDDGFTQIAAQDLGPETVLTTEIEYARSLPEQFRVVVGVYYNQVENLVELLSNADELLQYRNIADRVNVAGAEIEVNREWRRGWFFAANYSHQRARIGDLLDGTPLTNTPEHLAALKLAAPIGRTGVTLANRLRYESPRRTRGGPDTEPAMLWDVTVSGELALAHLSWAVGARNLLDWRHGQATGEDIASLQVPQLGRQFYARARVTW